MQETRVQSLGWEDPLEEEMTTHSIILAWKISWTEEPGGLQSMGSQRVRHDWATNAYLLTYCLSSCYSPPLECASRPVPSLAPVTCLVSNYLFCLQSLNCFSIFLHPAVLISFTVMKTWVWASLAECSETALSFSLPPPPPYLCAASGAGVVAGTPLTAPRPSPCSLLLILVTFFAPFLRISVWPPLVHLGAPSLLCIPLFVQYLQRCFLSCYFLESNKLPEDKYFSVEFWKAVVKNFSVGKRINAPSD